VNVVRNRLASDELYISAWEISRSLLESTNSRFPGVGRKAVGRVTYARQRLPRGSSASEE
jgi:hypothetical protein